MPAKVEIPPKLVAMIKARRVIPFLGAGFSSGLNLPDWDSLLARLADEIEGALPYGDVKKFCNNDYLQIAEYYLLVSDHRIGPLRHAIATALSTNNSDVLLSAPHVELVNFGAHQVYTTNYDDLIEKTFRLLKQPVEVVSLPKDVATATGAKTQVIKYHGDLRHEATLVLTESSYYARLDLESPMDLKFRSDLLGRSVLFIGYSFRDINIRIIWFKLMRMMEDIPQEDRPTSFIVTFSPNPVLERLYDEVGIETICLDPEAKALSAEARTKLLSRFMFDLATLASPDCNIPGQAGTLQFSSRAVTQEILAAFEETGRSSGRSLRRWGREIESSQIERLLMLAARRNIPVALKTDFANILEKLWSMDHMSIGAAMLALNYAKYFGADERVTILAARALCSGSSREATLEKSAPWKTLWGAKITRSQAERLIQRFQAELEGHQEGTLEDHDIAFICDIAHRITSGEIFDVTQAEIVELVKKFIAQASQLYPSIETHVPQKGEAPKVDEIIAEIDYRNQQEEKEEGSDNEDVAF